MTTEPITHCDPKPPGLPASHLRLAGAVTLGCALLGACDETPGRAAPGPSEAPSATTPREGQQADDDEPITVPADQCPDDRRIVRAPPAACVSVPGDHGHWNAVQLFADGTPSLAGAGTPPPGLAGYCQLTWAPDTSHAAPDLQVLGPLGAHESDCEVVWQQSDVLSDALSPALSATYLDHLDAPEAGDLLGARHPVVVAVIDSLSKATADGRSSHGESVGALIDGVQCPDAACDSRVRYRLALPRYLNQQDETQVDWVKGGNFGSQGELAKAIFGAVREWENHGSAGHLILNLSVGWEPSFGGPGAPADMPAPVRAVFDAMQYASCKGALIVAAAGNAAGACEEGPMAPAMWENHLAPSNAVCETIGAPAAPGRPAITPNDRLVYAVAGLRHDGRLLASTREKGRPRLAAPAFVAVNDAAGAPNIPMTGSSLAAASVSAVASLVWSYQHTLSPGAVIQQIYAAGVADVATTLADFGVKQVTHRVSACKALAACTTTPTSECPAVVCDDVPPDIIGLGAASTAAFAGLATPPVNVSLGNFSSKECEDACGTKITVRTAPGVLGDPCERDAVIGLNRSTSPQPRGTICPACFITNGAPDTAYLVIEEKYDLHTIAGVNLTVITEGKEHPIELGVLALSSSKPLTVRLPADLIDATSTATLHVTFADGEIQDNEIPVY
ncbi:MAG TPA: S8 family serine peptidase [Nannocystis sp.]|jgi:hypothetical protein